MRMLKIYSLNNKKRAFLLAASLAAWCFCGHKLFSDNRQVNTRKGDMSHEG
jgi:hypothetical protein